MTTVSELHGNARRGAAAMALAIVGVTGVAVASSFLTRGPAQQPTVASTPGPDDSALSPSGAQICSVAATPTCVRLDDAAAQELEQVLATATPAPEDAMYCQALSPTYTVRFDSADGEQAPIVVRVGCGPMEKDGRDHLLPAAAQQAVQEAYEAGEPISGATTTPSAP